MQRLEPLRTQCIRPSQSRQLHTLWHCSSWIAAGVAKQSALSRGRLSNRGQQRGVEAGGHGMERTTRIQTCQTGVGRAAKFSEEAVAQRVPRLGCMGGRGAPTQAETCRLRTAAVVDTRLALCAKRSCMLDAQLQSAIPRPAPCPPLRPVRAPPAAARAIQAPRRLLLLLPPTLPLRPPSTAMLPRPLPPQ